MADFIKNIENTLDVRFTLRSIAWLAQKKLSGLAAIRKDVEKWDTSALKPSFAFMQLILLERWDEAISILKDSRDRGELWVTSAIKMPPVRYVEEATERVAFALSS
ncbi:hypothetical protein ACIBQX_00560 [Nonomuraea sp. NPDC049714]|uniref:hypothetical protein n=1 Tax=Nonomuraea sp. NPDC049714 TaxID=3364357 RepID=UPI0037B42547